MRYENETCEGCVYYCQCPPEIAASSAPCDRFRPDLECRQVRALERIADTHKPQTQNIYIPLPSGESVYMRPDATVTEIAKTINDCTRCIAEVRDERQIVLWFNNERHRIILSRNKEVE